MRNLGFFLFIKMKSKLKILKDIDYEQITDIKPDGHKGNIPFAKRVIKRRAVFIHLLDKTMVEWIDKFPNMSLQEFYIHFIQGY